MNDLAQPAHFDSFVTTISTDHLTVAATALVEEIKARFDPMLTEATGLRIEIPHDPVAEGLTAFNIKLSEIREASNKVSSSLNLAIIERAKAKDRLNSAKVAFEEKLTLTMNHHTDVIAVQGFEAKKMKAKEILSHEGRVVSYADRIYTLVCGYHDAIKRVNDNLVDTKRDLMAQLAVIKQQISIGEVSSATFPVSTPGVSPAQNNSRALEQKIATELGDDGTVGF